MDQKINPSLLINRQLPAFIVQDFPQFALFLRKYYEHAEQAENGIGALRNVDSFWDVDEQEDENVLQLIYRLMIREIPNSAKIDRKFLLKNISEFYKSKGSVESIETLFRLIYDEEIELFIPREDIIKPSAGNFRKTVTILIDPPTYLNGDPASIYSYLGAEVFQSDEDGDVLARGVVEDIEENGEKLTLFMSIDKQLKDFDFNLPLRSFDNADPEIEARLEAKVAGGKLTNIIIRSAGRGYKRTPDVVIEGGRFNAGYEAAAIATTDKGVVTSVVIVNPGRNYLAPPRVRVVNEIRTTIQGNLGQTVVTNRGEFYQEGTPLVIDDSNGSGEKFTIDVVRSGRIASVFVESSGESFSPDDKIIFDNVTQNYNNKLITPDNYEFSIWFKEGVDVNTSGGSRFKYTTTNDDGSIIDTVSRKQAKILRANGRFGIHQMSQAVDSDNNRQFTLSVYAKLIDASDIDGVELIIAGEQAARILPVVSAGELIEVSIATSGANFTEVPSINVFSDQGTSAAVTPVITDGKITALTVDDVGEGYELNPQINVDFTNFVSAKFNLTDRILTSTETSGTASDLFAELQQVGEGVFRLILTGKINANLLDPELSHSFSAAIRLLKDGDQLFTSEDGVELFGALVNEGSAAQTYIEVPVTDSAEAVISEIDVNAVLLEDGSKIASGDDVYVIEDGNNGAILSGRIVNDGQNYIVEPSFTVVAEDGGVDLRLKAVLGRSGGVAGIDATAPGSGYINFRANTQPGQFNLWQANTFYQFRPGILRHQNNLYRLSGTGAINTTSVPPTHTGGTVTIGGIAYEFVQRAMTITIAAPNQNSRFVNSVSVASGGSGYTSTPFVFIDPPASPNGIQAKAFAVLNNGSVSSIVVFDKGSGYNGNEGITVGPSQNGLTAIGQIQFGGTAAQQATANAVLNDDGGLQSITVVNPGGGYSTQPVVSFSAPLETGARPTVSVDLFGSSIVDIIVENPGSGFIEIPNVIVDSPSSPVRFIKLLDGGTGYTSAPIVTVTGGGGAGTQAAATINLDGQVTSIVVIVPGIGYTSAPTVTITGGGGTGAAAQAFIFKGIELGNSVQADVQVGFELPIVTVSSANNTITLSAQDSAKLHPNDLITIETTGNLPGGLDENQSYHIVQKNGNSFKLSFLPDGVPINITSAGTGARTIRFFSIANELLQFPTDSISIIGEQQTSTSRNEFIDENNTDRFHLSIPERNFSFVIPSVQIEPEQINFVAAVDINPPEEIISTSPGIYFEYAPSDEYPVAGTVFDRRLVVFIDETLFNSLEPSSAIQYQTLSNSVLNIPFLQRNRTYFVSRKLIINTASTNFAVTLKEKIDGPEIVWDDSSSIVIGGQVALESIKFQQFLNAIFINQTELAGINNGDLLFFYREAFSELPGGLIDRQMYFVVQKSEESGFIRLSLTPNGPPINLSDQQGTQYRGSFFLYKMESTVAHSFVGYTQELTIDPSDLAQFDENDTIVYDAQNENIGNLVTDTNYRISIVDSNEGVFKLLDFDSFIPVKYTSAAAAQPGTHRITKVTETSNRLVFSQEDFDLLPENSEVAYLPTGGVQALATTTASIITYDENTELFGGGEIESPVTITEGGAFYITPPSVTFIDASVLRPVSQIVIRNAGSNFNVAPDINLSGGGGEGATAVCTINQEGEIDDIKIVNPGSGYFTAPLVEIIVTSGNTGGGAVAEAFLLPVGNGAAATATVLDGVVSEITITSAGTNYITPVIVIDAPDTKIKPLDINKAFFLVNRDAVNRSFFIAEAPGGLPIRLLTPGSATHIFEAVAQDVEYDMRIVNNYINTDDNILYTSINKTGNLSDKYEEIIRLQNSDRILLESSTPLQRKLNLIGNEESEKRTLVAEDTTLSTGELVLFDTDTTTNIGLTPSEFFFIRRQVDEIGSGFSLHTTALDAETDQNRIPLNTETFTLTDDLFRLIRFDKTLLEVGQIRAIRMRSRGGSYKALPRVFVDVPEIRFGTGAVLKPISEGIGGIRSIRIDNPGFDYETPRNFIFPVNLHLFQTSNANFIVGEEITVSSVVKGIVKAWDEQTELLTLSVVQGATFTPDSTVVGASSNAFGKILEVGAASGVANPTALTTFGGFYYGRKNLVNEINIRLQDSLIYQDFSYVVKSSKPFNTYSDVLKRNVHPAGIFVTGFVDYQVMPKNSSINTVNLSEVIVEVE